MPIPYRHFWSKEVRQEVFRIIWNFQKGKCAYCLCNMQWVNSDSNRKTSKRKRDMTLDHVIPTSKGGGKLHLWNMVLSCNHCNHMKQDHIWKTKIPIAYGNVDFPSEAIDDYDLCD